ncbi:uncharacterized protein TRUGW13939_06274 [Talaromyces rugulosus]|uniref:FAD-binding PCMH-type domain-containing protein n=1 Tax=Talaromyces rugulosus TaxID=121627 RepID=A0A7H8QYI6_TALRU|nr:uncharacterized protein TRUGW13939_06274 [Talaromyces rugulosus]QKX59142.1 hypothetical protein TRUGW13939_06274 [Talaromyces rugulosus]
MRFFKTLKAVIFAGAFCGSDALKQTPLGTDVNKFELQSEPQLVTGCLSACSALREDFGSQVTFSDERLYENELSRFWSLQQSQTLPACIFLPESSHDVASAVILARRSNCPFAVKSGGHAAFSGASNLEGGLTIDLVAINDITVNKERATVSVGPGNGWGDVYRQLENQNLTVVGGRIADVGVGGLSLGGGISFFSNRHGWACDNVASYEVVTASGDIIIATPTSHKALYHALRGGGNNFGIVTNFELHTYPHDRGLMWIGKVVHAGARNNSLIEAFVNFGERGRDPSATMLFSIVYLQKGSNFICVSELDYAEPIADEEVHPTVFDAFFKIEEPIQVTKSTKTIVNVIEDHSVSNPNGLRQSYWTATFHLDLRLAQGISDLWVQILDPIKDKVAGVIPVLTFQIITTSMMEHMGDKNGNSLGLEHEKEPLMLVALSAMWRDAADDDIVFEAYSKWLAESTLRAQELGLNHRYIYMNYASQFQDPIRGYGETNVAKLHNAAKEYDPDGVFQVLQPGYFKL